MPCSTSADLPFTLMYDPNSSSETHDHLSILGKPFTIRLPPPLLELDPCFFDEGYTLATQTASSIWEGAYAFINHLAFSPDLQRVIRSNRCIELGTGTGVCGIAVVVLGGDVIFSDVNSVLGVAQLNLDENFGKNRYDSGFDEYVEGRAITLPLDWTSNGSFKDTLFSTARVVIAVETCWLKEISRDFVKTFSRLLFTYINPRISDVLEPITFDGIERLKIGVWVYKERGLEESECFTTLAGMTRLFNEYGCAVKVIARQESKEDPGKHINVILVYLE